MKKRNNTDAPNWGINPKNAFLAALHVLVLVVSMVGHPPIQTGAARALP